jgi:hypothetical protein
MHSNIQKENNFLIYEKIKENDVKDFLNDFGMYDTNNFGEAEIIFPGKPSKSNVSLSSLYGYNEFPFHTDVAYWPAPAKYLAFYCINPGSGKRVKK